jgi:hypothetical protein
METNRNNIKSHVGETFTIDKVVRNRDGSPYIINNELQNPYILLTVSDNEYGQFNGFYRNYWLRLRDYPRFTLTQPLHYSKITGWPSNNPFPQYQTISTKLYTFLTANYESAGGIISPSTKMQGKFQFKTGEIDVSSLVKGQSNSINFVSNNVQYSSISYDTESLNSSGTIVIVGKLYYDDVLVCTGRFVNNRWSPEWSNEEFKTIYVTVVSTTLTVNIDGEMYAITPNFAVIENEDGEYVYWDNGWKPYECRFVKTFLSYDTKDWPAQKYYYSIQLVYGTTTTETLKALATLYNIEYSTDITSDNYMSNVDVVKKLSELGHKFPTGFDGEAPLWEPSSIPFLSRAELIMENYPQGGIF